MKKNYILTLLITLCITVASFGQGAEDFGNSPKPGSYSDGEFVGSGGITWTFVHSRRAEGNHSNEITTMNLPALLLRKSSSDSKITSSSISGGIGDFSVKLFKGFTGGGDRQVELFVNGVSKGISGVFDDYNEHVFSIENINITGDVVIEIKNTTAKQIIIDDITWTAYDSSTASLKNNAIIGFATYPNPVSDGILNISSASGSVKNLTIFNLLGKQVLSSSFSGVNKNIDVSSINTGMYILKVTEEGKTATKKLIIR